MQISHWILLLRTKLITLFRKSARRNLPTKLLHSEGLDMQVPFSFWYLEKTENLFKNDAIMYHTVSLATKSYLASLPPPLSAPYHCKTLCLGFFWSSSQRGSVELARLDSTEEKILSQLQNITITISLANMPTCLTSKHSPFPHSQDPCPSSCLHHPHLPPSLLLGPQAPAPGCPDPQHQPSHHLLHPVPPPLSLSCYHQTLPLHPHHRGHLQWLHLGNRTRLKCLAWSVSLEIYIVFVFVRVSWLQLTQIFIDKAGPVSQQFWCQGIHWIEASIFKACLDGLLCHSPGVCWDKDPEEVHFWNFPSWEPEVVLQNFILVCFL